MRRFTQVFTDQDAIGNAILAGEETSTTTGHYWLGMRTRQDLITSVNDALLGPQLINPIALFFFFEMVPYDRTLFCNNDPDFSGYSQWLTLRGPKK